ncbi:putative ABC-transporter integral membrane protein [Patulibacter medicamentivorans]|uniref:Putative ABC-transporter integral membrane protein n=2 Tax=Patulibacter medicamentivorans TaxID=1097667 RepID=H0E5N4_9ACTN|nr:putative ABC-transporter integral membrane protein [Patulibacter medicamentivorans]
MATATGTNAGATVERGQLPGGLTRPPAPPKGLPAPLGWIEQLTGMTLLTLQTMRAAVSPPYNWGGEFIEQCWLVTKRAFIPLMFCTLVFSYGAPGVTGGSILATLATTDRLGAFAVMASVRELATWINGMVIAGVAGTAICADLGARKVRDELDALAVLGTDLIKTLIVPRFFALGLMTVVFNYWNTAISLVGQLIANMTVWQESAAGYLSTFSSNFTIAEVAFNTLKVLTFGFIIAVVCCYKGMNAKGGAAGVGRAVNQAVVVSFCAVYVYNYLLNSLLLGAFPETSTLR